MVKIYTFLAVTYLLMLSFASAQAFKRDSTVKDTIRKPLPRYNIREEVRIYGETPEQRRLLQLTKTFNATDDVLEQVEGVSMMRRANFALEPTIRGYNAGQVAVVIDGMKMHSACVDRMDPVTAYIEIENLKAERKEILTDANQAITERERFLKHLETVYGENVQINPVTGELKNEQAQ
jgi:iron complex outermembrane receptor protein